MKPAGLKSAPQLKTANLIKPRYAGAKTISSFYGAKMLTLPAGSPAPGHMTHRHIKNISNHLKFCNQIIVKVSLDRAAGAFGGTQRPLAHDRALKDFANDFIDRALRREMDSEIAVMQRGENVAANQRRQRMLGRYLLSKPYRVIRNFYGVGMQRLNNGSPSEAGVESSAFYSDIIHERVEKTVHSPVQTHTERIISPTADSAAISDADLIRIADRAVRQMERKIRTQRERSGKW